MKGDFSRSTFDPQKHYTSVRMQQGRVQLDADWNEQADIFQHLLQTQLKDLLGPGSSPAGSHGFTIALIDSSASSQPSPPLSSNAGVEQPGNSQSSPVPDFQLNPGRLYVDGILCENDRAVPFTAQQDYPGASLPNQSVEGDGYLVYLDVWQRHISCIEDPAIREVALGGPDTTTRSRTVWQAKLLPLGTLEPWDLDDDDYQNLADIPEWRSFLEKQSNFARMSVYREKDGSELDNRLYRVEIHSVDEQGACFKWSRDNGAVAFPVTRIEVLQDDSIWLLSLDNLDRDPLYLQAGDWVELANDELALNGLSLPLCQIQDVNTAQKQVVLPANPDIPIESFRDLQKHPLIRRWDQNSKNGFLEQGAIRIEPEKWLDLEKGIQVFFSKAGSYRIGDYWQFTSRTKTGLEWPSDDSGQPGHSPNGVQHHLVPLALLHRQEERWGCFNISNREFASLERLTTSSIVTWQQLQATIEDLKNLHNTIAELVEQAELVKRYMNMERTRLYRDYHSDDDLEVGDIVALKTDDTDHVLRCSRQNDMLVLGVVAESPEDRLPNQHDFRVVLYGQAPCKVIGKIVPGDLLVPSSTEGCAHKSSSFIRPGTLIGKALSSHHPDHPEDIGTIDVLIMLG